MSELCGAAGAVPAQPQEGSDDGSHCWGPAVTAGVLTGCVCREGGMRDEGRECVADRRGREGGGGERKVRHVALQSKDIDYR